jgi:hypothetical protein
MCDIFCNGRYIPLSRTQVSFSGSSPAHACLFPSLSTPDETVTESGSSLIRCKYGSADAAAKVCILKSNQAYVVMELLSGLVYWYAGIFDGWCNKS